MHVGIEILHAVPFVENLDFRFSKSFQRGDLNRFGKTLRRFLHVAVSDEIAADHFDIFGTVLFRLILKEFALALPGVGRAVNSEETGSGSNRFEEIIHSFFGNGRSIVDFDVQVAAGEENERRVLTQIAVENRAVFRR